MSSDRWSSSQCDCVHQKYVMISSFPSCWTAKSITPWFGVFHSIYMYKVWCGALESACGYCWCGKFCTSFWTFLKSLRKYTKVDNPWVHCEDPKVIKALLICFIDCYQLMVRIMGVIHMLQLYCKITWWKDYSECFDECSQASYDTKLSMSSFLRAHSSSCKCYVPQSIADWQLLFSDKKTRMHAYCVFLSFFMYFSSMKQMVEVENWVLRLIYILFNQSI